MQQQMKKLALAMALGLGASVANAATVVLYEDFTAGMPAGWTTQWAYAWDGSGNGTAARNGSTNYTAWFPDGGALFFQRGTGNTPTGWRFAATPLMDLTAGGLLSFTLSLGSATGTDGPFERQDSNENVVLRYRVDGGAWTNLHVFALNDPAYSGANRWSLFEYSWDEASALAGSAVQFGWFQERHSGTYFDTWAIDNVSVSTLASPPVTGTVPEPGVLALLGIGVLGLLAGTRRRA